MRSSAVDLGVGQSGDERPGDQLGEQQAGHPGRVAAGPVGVVVDAEVRGSAGGRGTVSGQLERRGPGGNAGPGGSRRQHRRGAGTDRPGDGTALAPGPVRVAAPAAAGSAQRAPPGDRWSRDVGQHDRRAVEVGDRRVRARRRRSAISRASRSVDAGLKPSRRTAPGVAADDDHPAQVLRGRGRPSTTCRTGGPRGRRGWSGRGGGTTRRWRSAPRRSSRSRSGRSSRPAPARRSRCSSGGGPGGTPTGWGGSG